MGSNGIDIASLVKVGENPETAGNITTMLEGFAKNMKSLADIFTNLEKMGVSPKLVEKALLKYGGLADVPDLPDNSRQRGFQPASETHKAVFEAMNNMSEADLKTQMQEQAKKQKK